MLSRLAFRKTSLIDFPGRVAAVAFLSGCNFRCPYCHNAALVDPLRVNAEKLPSLGEFMAFLDARKGLISGLVISGGEPLIHEEAPRLAKAARDRGLAVKLDTNGSLPDRILALGPDYIALDLKTAIGAYARVAPGMPGAGEAVLESLRVVRASGIEYELRVTCAPGIVGASEIKALCELLEAGDRVVLQDFRPGGCLDPAWDSATPYPDAVMDGFLSALRKRAPLARRRGQP